MKNVVKILSEDNAKREAVLAILKILDNENISDATEILDVIKHYLKNHSYLDFSLAKAEIDFDLNEEE